MVKLFLALLFFVALTAVLLFGYSYVGDLSPETEPMSIPVELDAN